eukprot:411741-Pelagomonas_calceolata.AAC.3
MEGTEGFGHLFIAAHNTAEKLGMKEVPDFDPGPWKAMHRSSPNWCKEPTYVLSVGVEVKVSSKCAQKRC